MLSSLNSCELVWWQSCFQVKSIFVSQFSASLTEVRVAMSYNFSFWF